MDQLAAIAGDYVVLGNIAFVENGIGRTPVMSDKIVMTVIKTEEEAALKNQPAYRRDPVSGVLNYANPPIFLNIYLLITANYSDYPNALTQLSRVIGYFQHKRVFTDADSAVSLPPGSPIQHFDFNLSMVSPSFEQINHIWSVLGGKHLPNVLYKVQLIQLEYIPDEAESAPIIEIIELDEKIF
jgi:Pvc16 N-terminal domain